ncbi:MAG: response regulator, partial [Inhella sp.]
GEPFDVALLDWRMPGLDGVAAARRLRELPGAPRCILVTAHGQGELGGATEQAGLSAVLHKPVNASELFDALMQALAGDGRWRAAPQRRAATAAPLLRGLRVLLVEDNELNQDVARGLLEELGVRVELAADGAQALASLAQGPLPDLVLMDMQMPVMDGLAATRAIRQELGLGTLPIVAMTANALAADRLACLEAGMNEHVGKPFEMAPLVALIQRLVGVAAQGLAQPAGPAIDPTRLQQARAEGIDLQAAMERFMGRAGLYLRTCRSFARSARALPAQLRGHQGLPATERAEADRQALHGFKGLAATLAASTLAQWGATGEGQARAGEALDPAWIAALDQEIERGCTALLRHAQALADERSEPGKPAPAAQAEGPLKELRQLVQAQDLRALSVAAERRLELERFLGEELASLDEALASLDFERAKALLEAS